MAQRLVVPHTMCGVGGVTPIPYGGGGREPAQLGGARGIDIPWIRWMVSGGAARVLLLYGGAESSIFHHSMHQIPRLVMTIPFFVGELADSFMVYRIMSIGWL